MIVTCFYNSFTLHSGTELGLSDMLWLMIKVKL